MGLLIINMDEIKNILGHRVTVRSRTRKPSHRDRPVERENQNRWSFYTGGLCWRLEQPDEAVFGDHFTTLESILTFGTDPLFHHDKLLNPAQIPFHSNYPAALNLQHGAIPWHTLSTAVASEYK